MASKLFKGGYTGNFRREYYGVMKGVTRSLEYSSYVHGDAHEAI